MDSLRRIVSMCETLRVCAFVCMACTYAICVDGSESVPTYAFQCVHENRASEFVWLKGKFTTSRHW